MRLPAMSDFPGDYRIHDGVWIPKRAAREPFAYNDGDEVETRILRSIRDAKDRSLFSRELRSQITDWPSLYHLSPLRANLLRPFEPLLKSRVLEVGAGCGAIARYLGELGGDVVAIEPSLRRAEIARERTGDLPNVRIVSDRVQDFTASEPFDVITLIGVIEYARVFAGEVANPEISLLTHLRSLLAPDGILILATENQLGLKYFAGALEDHVGVEFWGVNDSYSPRSVVTFGRQELQDIITDAGFPGQRVYLPFPDYKLPSTVLSPAGIVTSNSFDVGSIVAQSPRYDRQAPAHPTFSLEKAWKVICRNGLITDNANSFLIVAGKSPDALAMLAHGETLAWHYSADRHPAFVKETAFVNHGFGISASRRALAVATPPSIPLTCAISSESYITGNTLWDILIDIVNRPGWTSRQIADWTRDWSNFIGERSGLGTLTPATFSSRIDGKFLDATPFNMVVDATGRYHFIDQEWILETPAAFGFVVYRGLMSSLDRVTSVAVPAPGTSLNVNELMISVFLELGLTVSPADIGQYAALEARIQNWVEGRNGEPSTSTVAECLSHHALRVRMPRRSLETVQARENVRAEL